MKAAFENLKNTNSAVQSAMVTADASFKAKKGWTALSSLNSAANNENVTEEEIARVAAQIASILDPTGIASVVKNYTYPKCSKIFQESKRNIDYGADVFVRNMYQEKRSFLEVRYSDCERGSKYCVSTAETPERSSSGESIWRVVPRNGAQNGTPVRFGDEVHLQNKYNNWASYLDINGGGCEGNVYCVSAASTPNRDNGTGVWRIRSASGKPDGMEVSEVDDIHLEIVFNLTSTYLDIRESGCEDNLYCVSTANTPTRDRGTGTWRMVPEQ